MLVRKLQICRRLLQLPLLVLLCPLVIACGSSKASPASGTPSVAGSSATAGASGSSATAGAGGVSGSSATAGASGASAGAGGSASATASATFTVDVSLSSKIATVGIVTWSIDKTITGAHIDFGRDQNNFEYQAPVDLTVQSYRTLLLGMKANTTYYLRVVADGGGVTYMSDVQSIKTGFLPNGLPVQTIKEHDASKLYAGGGFTVLCTGYAVMSDVGSEASSAFIFDKDGALVWALDLTGTGAVGCTRARMSYDGQYMWAGNFGNFSSSGALTRITMDGLSTPQNYQLPGRSHDFAILPSGHIVYFARNNGGAGQSAESIKELDPASGMSTQIYDETTDFTLGASGGHTNQVNYVPELQAISFSMLFQNSIGLISYPGGKLLGVFGGTQSSFSNMSWNGQHGHDVRADHINIFNNTGKNGGSSVLRFSYDLTSKLATAQPDYSPGLDSVAFGDVKELPNGNFFVTYSTSSAMHELDSSLTLLREISTNTLIGYTEHRATLYGVPPPYDR